MARSKEDRYLPVSRTRAERYLTWLRGRTDAVLEQIYDCAVRAGNTYQTHAVATEMRRRRTAAYTEKDEN